MATQRMSKKAQRVIKRNKSIIVETPKPEIKEILADAILEEEHRKHNMAESVRDEVANAAKKTTIVCDLKSSEEPASEPDFICVPVEDRQVGEPYLRVDAPVHPKRLTMDEIRQRIKQSFRR